MIWVINPFKTAVSLFRCIFRLYGIMPCGMLIILCQDRCGRKRRIGSRAAAGYDDLFEVVRKLLGRDSGCFYYRIILPHTYT